MKAKQIIIEIGADRLSFTVGKTAEPYDVNSSISMAANLRDAFDGVGLLEGRYDRVLASHGDGELVKDVIAENIALCGRILAGEDDAAPMEFMGASGRVGIARGEPGHGNIVYDPARLR